MRHTTERKTSMHNPCRTLAYLLGGGGLLSVSIAFTSLAVRSSSLNVPHLFQSGGVIRADQINDNFQFLNERLRQLERKYAPAPVGTIFPFAGPPDRVPEGWMLCNGQEVSRAEYPALFEIIGTLWGDGNGHSTFNLPDLRGQFLRGADMGAKIDPDASGRKTLRGGVVGDRAGSYQADEFRSHFHYAYVPHDQYGSGDDFATTSTDDPDESFYPYLTSETGGKETRPKNASVNYIIKY